MPVKAVGRKIIEISSGRVVGTAKSVSAAKASARIRNAAHAAKKRGKKFKRRKKSSR